MTDRDDGGSPDPGEARERARLLAAIRRTVGEQGYRGVTIEAVARAARLPRERFEAHFASREEALLVVQREFLDRLHAQVVDSCEGSSSVWYEQVRAGLGALLSNLAEAEGLARALAVEGPASSFGAAQQQFEALERFARLLRAGRSRYPDSSSLPGITERLLVGGVASLLAESLLAEEAAASLVLEPQLLELLLMPYLGMDGARRVARA